MPAQRIALHTRRAHAHCIKTIDLLCAQYPTTALDRLEEWEKNKPDLGSVYRQVQLEKEIDKALAEKRARQAAAR